MTNVHTGQRDIGDRDIGDRDTGNRDTGQAATGQRADRHGEERARAAVLEMTKTMLNEVGYQRLRVETVAARAGVPRVWLRRWWTTRPLLVAEALQRMGGPPDIVPTGDARSDVRAVVLRTATFLANPVVGDALAGMAADAVRDAVAAERLAALLAARRACDTAVLLSAVARGDLRPDTDVPLLLDTVYGSLLFRLARGAPPTPAVVDALVDLVLAGQGAATVDPHPLGGDRPDETRLHGRRSDPDEFDELPPEATRLDGRAFDGSVLDAHTAHGHPLDTPTRDDPGTTGDDADGQLPDGQLPDDGRSDGQEGNGVAREPGLFAESHPTTWSRDRPRWVEPS